MSRATIYAPNDPYRAKTLAECIRLMKMAGSPTIRCVDFKKYWRAIEGSHRLKAASILKVPVIIQPVAVGDEFEADWNPNIKIVYHALIAIDTWGGGPYYRPEVVVKPKHKENENEDK